MAVADVEHCEETCVHNDVVNVVRSQMPDEDEMYDLAELFKVFGDSSRIKILFALFKKFRKLRHGARYIYLLRADCCAGSASYAG